ncbi:MAG: glycosyltransferase family 39 protein [Vampirovibrionales bacterium]
MAQSFLNRHPKRMFYAGFLLLCLLHTIVWTVIPWLTRYSLHVDMTECYAWALSPEWSYYKHPPLIAWVIAGFFKLLPSHDITYYLLSQCNVLVAYLGLWQLGQAVFHVEPSSQIPSPLPDPKASSTSHPIAWSYPFLSVLLCETVFFYTSHSPTFNHNTILLPLWAWTLYAGYQAFIQSPKKIGSWIGFGIMAALTLYGKYYSGALLLSIAVWSWMHPQTRSLWRTPFPSYALLTMGLCLSPHVLATLQQGSGTLAYAEDLIQVSSLAFRVSSLKNFTLSQVAHVAPLLLVLWASLRHESYQALKLACMARLRTPLTLQAFKATFTKAWHNAPVQSYLWMVSVGSCAITLILCVALGVKTSSKWTFPMWGILPMAILASFPYAFQLRRVVLLSSIVALVVPSFLILKAWLGFEHHRAFLYQQPIDTLAQYVTDTWHQRYHTPLYYVGGILHVPTGISFYSTDHPLSLLHLDPHTSPWIQWQKVRQKGLLVACDLSDTPCQHKALTLFKPFKQRRLSTWVAPSRQKHLSHSLSQAYWLLWIPKQS